MAVKFNEINQWYQIPDSAELSFPNGDWSLGVWTNVADNAGTLFQYVISTGSFGVTGSLNLYLNESGASSPNEWRARIEGTTLTASTATDGDGKDRLIVLTRSGTTVRMYFCEPGKQATLQASATLSNALNGAAWNIGRRADGNVDRYYGGIAGEVFKGDWSLTADEITALGSGRPIWSIGKIPTVYLPMETAEATLTDLIGTHDATRNGTPTTVDHFPVSMPVGAQIINFPVTSGGSVTAAPLTGTVSWSGGQPAVRSSLSVQPVTGALSLQGGQPLILSGASVSVQPVTGTMAFSGQQPTVRTAVTAKPFAASILWSGGQPAVGVGSLVTAQPIMGTVSFVGGQPAITTQYIVKPSAGRLSFQGAVPSIIVDRVTVVPSTGKVIFSGRQPTVIARNAGWTKVGAGATTWGKVAATPTAWTKQ